MSPSLVRGRRILPVAAVLALLTAAALTTSAPSASGEQSLATSTPTGPMELPAEWMTAQRLSDGGTDLSAAKYARARGEANQLAAHTRSVYRHLAEQEWNFSGPSNIGGRVVDIAVDPQVPDQVFIAAASGGLWRSANAGATFEPAWPTPGSRAWARSR